MQEKFKFDEDTIKKIGKGALIAGVGGAAIAILGYIGALDIEDPMAAGLVAWFVPFATNAVKEWAKGV